MDTRPEGPLSVPTSVGFLPEWPMLLDGGTGLSEDEVKPLPALGYGLSLEKFGLQGWHHFHSGKTEAQNCNETQREGSPAGVTPGLAIVASSVRGLFWVISAQEGDRYVASPLMH